MYYILRCKKDIRNPYDINLFTKGIDYDVIGNTGDWRGYQVINDLGNEHTVGLPGTEWFEEHFILWNKQ